jgi:hypothetical protein
LAGSEAWPPLRVWLPGEFPIHTGLSAPGMIVAQPGQTPALSWLFREGGQSSLWTRNNLDKGRVRRVARGRLGVEMPNPGLWLIWDTQKRQAA